MTIAVLMIPGQTTSTSMGPTAAYTAATRAATDASLDMS
jgi:hypothetical protein